MAGDGKRWRDSPELIESVRSLHAAGKTSREIATELGVRRSQIDGLIGAKGWSRPTVFRTERLVLPTETETHRVFHYQPPKQVRTEVSVFLNDLHIPNHDPEAVRVALNLIAYVKPATVFLLGDIFDFYQLSKFDQNPKRLTGLQSELNQLYDFFIDLRRAAPKAEIHYIEGNHERRLTKYLWSNPKIANLDDLQIGNLFRLDHWNIQWHPQEDIYEHHGFLVTHGSIVRKYAGYSAKGEWDKHNASGISGHTHRCAAFPKTTRNGVYAWYENGCLADLSPEYVVGTPDWQHAISVGHFIEGDNRFSIEQIQMPKHKLLYRGMLFD